jgi:serine O-acetyltransferase
VTRRSIPPIHGAALRLNEHFRIVDNVAHREPQRHKNTTISSMNIIREDLRAQREGLLGLGFWALLVYRFGHARFIIGNKIIRAPWTVVYIVLHKLVEIFCGISIGSSASIGRRLSIEHHGCIVVHGSTIIGDDCLIRHGVTLGNTGPEDPSGAPRLGDRVHVGAGAKVLGRVTVGNDVIIGANAVVVGDIPSNSVVGGVPARVLKTKS